MSVYACQWSTNNPDGCEGRPAMSLHATEADAEAAAAEMAKVRGRAVVVFELSDEETA